MIVSSHDLARALLRLPEADFRALTWGRLSVVWDSKRPVGESSQPDASYGSVTETATSAPSRLDGGGKQ